MTKECELKFHNSQIDSLIFSKWTDHRIEHYLRNPKKRMEHYLRNQKKKIQNMLKTKRTDYMEERILRNQKNQQDQRLYN